MLPAAGIDPGAPVRPLVGIVPAATLGLDQLLLDATAAGARQVIAIIADSGEPASIALHRTVGFAKVGLLHKVGHKHGRWIEVVLMQAELAPIA